MLKITSFKVNYRDKGRIPYMVVNCTFTVSKGEYLYELTKRESEDYTKTICIDDPERYENWLDKHWDLQKGYDGWSNVWTMQDPCWKYLEKFDTFWFREWVSDSSVTRSITSELDFYFKNQKLPSKYRHTDESVVLRHLRTLGSYWD